MEDPPSPPKDSGPKSLSLCSLFQKKSVMSGGSLNGPDLFTELFQETRVYPYPLVAGSARPNPQMGAPDPENPLFLGFSVLRGGPRPWSETMVLEGSRPWGGGRSGDCDYYQTSHSLNAYPLFTEDLFFLTERCFVASPSQRSAPTLRAQRLKKFNLFFYLLLMLHICW